MTIQKMEAKSPLRGLGRRLVAMGAVIALLLMSGCGRQVELAYQSSQAVEDLPASHAEQIAAQLGRLFGTPTNPRLAQPGEDVDAPLEDLVSTDRLAHGAAVFNRRCAGCHGVTGDGAGEAAEYLQPRPRDYRRGIFKFTSTPYGSKPTRKDLVRVIRRGAKGTSMPSFPFISDDEVRDLVDYVIALSYRGELELAMSKLADLEYEEDEEIEFEDFSRSFARIQRNWESAQHAAVLPVTARPRYDDDSILQGRKAFLSKGCSKCHGPHAEGQLDWLSSEFIAEQESKPAGERIQINYDAWKQPAPAADLTAGMLHGGRRPIDVYRRVYTGINGTPMPAFGQALAEEPETIWHIVHYVLSVIENREVEGLEDVKAEEPAAAAASLEPRAESQVALAHPR